MTDPRSLVDAGMSAWVGLMLDRAIGWMGGSGEVRVLLVDDERMSAEHGRTLGDPTTTDVLTFDLSGDDAELDVDLLVCVDEARRQAEARGHGLREELLLYALHGCLHCLGYDDTDEVSAARMHAREDEVLEAIGVGRVFSGGVGR